MWIGASWVRTLGFVFAFAVGQVSEAETLVELGSVWRYLDNGSNQGSVWRHLTFDDSGWDSGPAKLGYGDSDVVTEVSYGLLPFLKHMTTYFRHSFIVADPDAYTGLLISLQRDDGAVIYLNGVEVGRSNMPPLGIDFLTPAAGNVSGSDEDFLNTILISPEALQSGNNVLAVEVHQSSPFSSDLGFNLSLEAQTDLNLARGPFLQKLTPNSVTIRWRTEGFSRGRVQFGDSPSALTTVVDEASFKTEHEVFLTGLEPDTLYYYSIGRPGETLTGGDLDTYFITAPESGSETPFRVWVIGDAGTQSPSQEMVRDAYLNYSAGTHTDLWLMLGDNAYSSGTDTQYQGAVFDMYPSLLRTSPTWPTRGNHEEDSAYLDIFSLPEFGEAGGAPSGTEQYYSFDYGNCHFVCMSSYEYVNAIVGSAMWNWLIEDLAQHDQEWLIAYWHHPPYSKGSHDSDTSWKQVQMRTVYNPLLEAAGADLILGGHSHGYERSFLVREHYGLSFLLTPNMIVDSGKGRAGEGGIYRKRRGPLNGTVYAVVGSSGQISSSGSLDHPIMTENYVSLGSLVLDFDGTRLDAKMLAETGQILDEFTIEHIEEIPFRRGDINQDDVINLADAINLLNFLFLPGLFDTNCRDSLDTNDDGSISIADPIALLEVLFSGTGPLLPTPFESCGEDPTNDDSLGCDSFSGCQP